MTVGLPNSVRNRKAYLQTVNEMGWEIRTFAHVMEWTEPHLCTDSATFHSGEQFHAETDRIVFDATPFAYKTQMLVLAVFERSFVEEGSRQSFGLIMSNRDVFHNVLRVVADQDIDGVIGTTDGTYKLHFGTIMSLPKSC